MFTYATRNGVPGVPATIPGISATDEHVENDPVMIDQMGEKIEINTSRSEEIKGNRNSP